MSKRIDIDAILAESRRRVDREVTCPNCGAVAVQRVHPLDAYMLCDACGRAIGEFLLGELNKHNRR